jgi:hypothetical protein
MPLILSSSDDVLRTNTFGAEDLSLLNLTQSSGNNVGGLVGGVIIEDNKRTILSRQGGNRKDQPQNITNTTNNT